MSQKIGLFKKAIVEIQQKNMKCDKFFYRTNRWKLREPSRLRFSVMFNVYPVFGLAVLASIIQDQKVKYEPEAH